jgi:hypothetical protein
VIGIIGLLFMSMNFVLNLLDHITRDKK